MSAIVVLAAGLAFPEGPTVAADGAIWVSELKGQGIARIEAGGRIDRYQTGGEPNGLAFAPDGSLWFCDQARGEVRRLDLASGSTKTIASTVDGEPLAAPNDLAFAPDGTLVFTCPGDSRREPTGYVCRRRADGAVDRLATGFLFPNGVCFSPDGDRLFLAETYGCRVSAAAWSDDEGLLTFGCLFDTPGPIGADGLAATDAVVATCVHGAGVVRVAGTSGHAICDVTVPDARPAGCAADPLGRWSMIVTGAERGVVLGVTL